jgi:hypothetical protein
LLAIEVAASSLAYDKGLKARCDGWSSISERGPNDTLTTSTLLDFAIRLGEIE